MAPASMRPSGRDRPWQPILPPAGPPSTTTTNATIQAATLPADLTDRLKRLVAGRQAAADRIIAAARAGGAGAVLLVGSLAAPSGSDAFSDLDLVIVPGASYFGIDATRVFGPQLLAQATTPHDAPPGGAHLCVCLDVAHVVLWLDLIEWPAETAAAPADSIIVYDQLGLPDGPLGLPTVLTDHRAARAATTHPVTGAVRLRQVATAAKYLARGEKPRIVELLPDAAGLPLSQIRPLLHYRLVAIGQPELARATAGTAALVDLADAVRAARRSDDAAR